MWLGGRFSALPMEISGFESPLKAAGKQTRKRAKLGDSGEKKFNATRPALSSYSCCLWIACRHNVGWRKRFHAGGITIPI